MVLFLSGHVLAAEFVSAQQSKGDVLLFQHTRRPRKISATDIEKAPSNMRSITSKDAENAGAKEHSSGIPLSIKKQNSILTCSGLKYEIAVGGKVRRLLDEVDGWVKPGTLTALMVW